MIIRSKDKVQVKQVGLGVGYQCTYRYTQYS
jgi:hypothetical protein